MLTRSRLIAPIARRFLGLPDRAAHGLIVRDLSTWIRLEFLGVAARSGIADALAAPRTVEEIALDTGIDDQELLGALLALGVALGELQETRGRYHVRGRRMRAIARRSPDLRGVVEELVTYDNPVYARLVDHLRGLPEQPYDQDCGEVIAAASRIAEPVLGAAVRTVAADVMPSSVLDIGCGSGTYLRAVLEVQRAAKGTGIEIDDAVAKRTSVTLADLGTRCTIESGDIAALADGLGEFDLVLLLNNIYYWAPDQRADLLRSVRTCVRPGGTLVVATATPDGQPFNRHLDLMLRVTASSDRLPTTAELRRDLDDAGFDDIAMLEPIPASGLTIATASR